MAGIIDKHGQQWEHCNCCGKQVKYQDLKYNIPCETAKIHWLTKYPERVWLTTNEKLDLCKDCTS